MIKATYIDHMGTDLSVVNAARVSFGKKSDWETDYGQAPCGTEKLSDRDVRLIHYLAKHKHLSPFGHCFASFHVKAPIFVARRLVKHKFLRWNEVSRRYVDSDPEIYMPEAWRGRSDDKKQGSSDEVVKVIQRHGSRPESVREVVTRVSEAAIDCYRDMIESGVSPEQARMILPQSTMTEWWWSGSLDAFAAMCKLRCEKDTQYESRIVADQISKKMLELFSVSWDALMANA